ncbi:MAG: hypothetical protein WC340_10940 [Kiritimatiellia bacterium]
MPLTERLLHPMLADDDGQPAFSRSGFQPDMSDWKSDLRCAAFSL